MSDTTPQPQQPTQRPPLAPQTVPETKPPTVPAVPQKNPATEPKAPTPIAKTKPPGWWNVIVMGYRDAVVKNIKADATLPAGRKQALIEDIQSLPVQFNFVKVVAHRHVQGGKAVVNETITGSTVLTS